MRVYRYMYFIDCLGHAVLTYFFNLWAVRMIRNFGIQMLGGLLWLIYMYVYGSVSLVIDKGSIVIIS